MTIVRRKLPVVPKGVDVKRLHDNLRLFSQDEIAWLKENFTENGRYREYVDENGRSKKLAYPVFVFNGKYFASYPGKEFHFGDQARHGAKLAQDLDSGEWVVEKVLRVLAQEDEDASYQIEAEEVDYEKDFLHQRGKSIVADGEPMYLLRPFPHSVDISGDEESGIVSYLTSDAEEELELEYRNRAGKHYLFMQREPGLNLHEWALRELPVVVRMDMSIALTSVLMAWHGSRLLHRDVKDRNAVYDMIRDRLALVDFGLAMRVEDLNNDLYSEWGTPGYMAPEIRGNANSYSEKSDIYAYGVTLGVLWGLMDINRLEDKDEAGYEAVLREKSSLVLPRQLESYLRRLVIALTKSDPDEREQLEDVYACLRAQRARLADEYKVINVAVVDAASYQGELAKCDLVKLLDSTGALPDWRLLTIKQDLEARGFVVDDEIYVGPVAAMQREIQAESGYVNGRIYRMHVVSERVEERVQSAEELGLMQAVKNSSLVRRRVQMQDRQNTETADVRIPIMRYEDMQRELTEEERRGQRYLQADTYDWGDWAVWFFGNMREDCCRVVNAVIGGNTHGAGCFGLFGSCMLRAEDPLSPAVVRRVMQDDSDEEAYTGQEMARLGV